MTVTGWVFLAAFLLLVVGGVAFVIASDRKRRPFAASEQEFLSAGWVTGRTNSNDPAQTAAAAIRQVGGAQISTSDDGSRIVGWIGNTWTNIPSRQEYQLLIEVRGPQAGPEFRCLARPRFSSSLGGNDRAGQLSRALSNELAAASG
jgi:hypothetical protein